MEQTIKNYISKLESDANVVGVILFGSYARGDNRPDSDIDLIVLLQDGESYRKVVLDGGKTYECIYTTVKGALDYWKGDLDGCFNIWNDAEIVVDKNGDVKKLELESRKLVAAGKKKLSEWNFDHKKFDSEDQLKAISELSKTDIPAANLALSKVVINLVEWFFDIKQLWTPPTKKQLQAIRKVDIETGKLFDSFYSQEMQFEQRLSLAKEIVKVVYTK